MKICKAIDEYIEFVRSEEAVVCKEQLLLCDFVEKVFTEEDVYVDEKQLERYFGLQKHFFAFQTEDFSVQYFLLLFYSLIFSFSPTPVFKNFPSSILTIRCAKSAMCSL